MMVQFFPRAASSERIVVEIPFIITFLLQELSELESNIQQPDWNR